MTFHWLPYWLRSALIAVAITFASYGVLLHCPGRSFPYFCEGIYALMSPMTPILWMMVSFRGPGFAEMHMFDAIVAVSSAFLWAIIASVASLLGEQTKR